MHLDSRISMMQLYGHSHQNYQGKINGATLPLYILIAVENDLTFTHLTQREKLNSRRTWITKAGGGNPGIPFLLQGRQKEQSRIYTCTLLAQTVEVHCYAFLPAQNTFTSYTLFCSSSLQPVSSVFLSHHSSSSLQPPASQQCFSLTPLQQAAAAFNTSTVNRALVTKEPTRNLHIATSRVYVAAWLGLHIL